MSSKKAALTLRNAEIADIPAILALSRKIRPNRDDCTPGMISGQLNSFPQGAFVVTQSGEIVGYAAAFLLNEEKLMTPHGRDEITGGGYFAQHNGKGDWLYGAEMLIDPTANPKGVAKKLRQAREQLCVALGLKGAAFAAAMPGWRKAQGRYPNPDAYLEAVTHGRVKAPVLRSHIRNGAETQGALVGYDPADAESDGCAARMIWRNPSYSTADEAHARQNPNMVRVASVQLQARTLRAPEEFYQSVSYFVSEASDYGADFVLLPEHLTLMLLSCEKTRLPPEKAVKRATEHTAEFVKRMRDLAVSRHINIVAGSHMTRTETGAIRNVGYVFLRSGAIHTQEKLHPTPDERSCWSIGGGDGIGVIETDCGPIGVQICYDSEFPEAARRLADEGARILFVPYLTDTRQGHLRVRYCCHARAVENQYYVVTAGMVGALANVENAGVQYAQSAILTPCDHPFARDGIAAETSANVEMMIFADLDLSLVPWARDNGSVRNLRDRRFDLYRTKWSDGG